MPSRPDPQALPAAGIDKIDFGYKIVRTFVRRLATVHVSYTDLRKNLASYMDRANDDRDAILVTRQGKESVVMIAASEFDSLTETTYLLRSPRNAEILLASIADADAGKLVERALVR